MLDNQDSSDHVYMHAEGADGTETWLLMLRSFAEARLHCRGGHHH